MQKMGEKRLSSRVTMQDVANHVGVHQTTVSIALRNHPSIPEATRLKIQTAARELGYRKDPAIEAFNRHRLMRRGSGILQKIAFVTDVDSETEFFRDPVKAAYFEGAKRRAEELNYRMELVMLSSLGRNVSEGLKAGGYSSLVIGSISSSYSLNLDWKDWSAVAIDSFQLESELDVFAPNYRQASRLAVKQLFSEKYSRIGYFGPSSGDDLVGSFSQVGYLVESRVSGLPALQCTRAELSGNDELILEWIEEDDLDAVICQNKLSSEAIERVCRVYGKEIRIVALDTEGEGAEIDGIDLGRERVGFEAVSALATKQSTGWQNVDLMPTVSFAPAEWRETSAEKSEPALKRA